MLHRSLLAIALSILPPCFMTGKKNVLFLFFLAGEGRCLVFFYLVMISTLSHYFFTFICDEILAFLRRAILGPHINNDVFSLRSHVAR